MTLDEVDRSILRRVDANRPWCAWAELKLLRYPRRRVDRLVEAGFVFRDGRDCYSLTDAGVKALAP